MQGERFFCKPLGTGLPAPGCSLCLSDDSEVKLFREAPEDQVVVVDPRRPVGAKHVQDGHQGHQVVQQPEAALDAACPPAEIIEPSRDGG